MGLLRMAKERQHVKYENLISAVVTDAIPLGAA
jgi:hypothetical protein